MREIKSAHAAAGPHGKAFGQLDAGVLFDVEQFPENSFLRVVGAGGITGGRADAAIFFLDQIFGVEIFGFAKAPFVADAFVQIFGEGLGQTIRQRLGHDGVVIVVVVFEFLDEFLEAMAAGDGEGADVIRESAGCWIRFGAMKSARHQFGVPSPFSICWRRKWNVVKTLVRDSSV